MASGAVGAGVVGTKSIEVVGFDGNITFRVENQDTLRLLVHGAEGDSNVREVDCDGKGEAAPNLMTLKLGVDGFRWTSRVLKTYSSYTGAKRQEVQRKTYSITGEVEIKLALDAKMTYDFKSDSWKVDKDRDVHVCFPKMRVQNQALSFLPSWLVGVAEVKDTHVELRAVEEVLGQPRTDHERLQEVGLWPRWH